MSAMVFILVGVTVALVVQTFISVRFILALKAIAAFPDEELMHAYLRHYGLDVNEALPPYLKMARVALHATFALRKRLRADSHQEG